MSVLFDSVTDWLVYESKHPAWVTGTTYTVGQKVYNRATYDYAYNCITQGGGASTVAPTGTGTTGVLADGYNWTCIQTGPAGGLFEAGFPATGLSFSVWIKPTADSAVTHFVGMASRDGYENEGYRLYKESANTISADKRDSSGGSGSITTDTMLVANGWHHVVGTLSPNGTGAKYAYLNGVAAAVDSLNRNVLAAPSRMYLGRSIATNSNSTCYMAHFAIYKSVLSGSDVSALYNGGSGGNGANPTTVNASNLVAYWSLAEGDITASLTSQDANAFVLTNNNTTYSSDNPNVDPFYGLGAKSLGLLLRGCG